jgi:hypothetical protein
VRLKQLNGMTHKKLKTKARKMRMREEIKRKVPIFQTNAWNALKRNILDKVENRIKKVKKNKASNFKAG